MTTARRKSGSTSLQEDSTFRFRHQNKALQPGDKRLEPCSQPLTTPFYPNQILTDYGVPIANVSLTNPPTSLLKCLTPGAFCMVDNLGLTAFEEVVTHGRQSSKIATKDFQRWIPPP